MSTSHESEEGLEALVGRIADEFTERCQRGEQPVIDDYLERYPEIADILHDVLPAVLVLGPRPPGSLTMVARQTDAGQPAQDLPWAAVHLSSGQCAAPVRLGDYELLGELGRGGVGVVFQARQTKLNRIVALKMLRSGLGANPEEMQRFRTEALAIAQLQHANIVQIYEVDAAEGHPYFSMEYVNGGSLAANLQATPQPPLQAAEFIETLARAMHYSHQRGIIHRDLKPANVLLQFSREPGEGALAPGSRLNECVPKISDFGLVKRLDDDSGQTQTGSIVGTPSYMAPEQAAGQTRAVSPATDVYALGAILYEMLAGRPPFKGTTPIDTLDQVRHREPVPPSQLQPGLPRDLETICLKCLRKDPAQRYATALALAEDLRRFQLGQPIQARPVGYLERLVKWVRRRPAFAACIVLSLLAGLAATAFLVRFSYSKRLETAVLVGEQARVTAEEQRQKADQARSETEQALNLANSARQTAETQTQQAEQARGETRDALRREQNLLYSNRILLAQSEWKNNNLDSARQLLEQCPEEFRHWEWHHLNHLCHAELMTIKDQKWKLYGLALSPDGNHIVSVVGDQTVEMWEAATGKAVWKAPFKRSGLSGPSFSPDGKRIALGKVGTPELLESPNGFVVKPGPPPPNEIKILDAATGRQILSFQGHKGIVVTTAFSPDGRLLATSALDGTVRIWDSITGKEFQELHGKVAPGPVAFSPDSQRLATSGPQGTVVICDVATGRDLLTLPGQHKQATSLSFSSDGQRLLVSSGSSLNPEQPGSLKIWDISTEKEVLTIHGYGFAPVSAVFRPDGKYLAGACSDRTIRVWDVTNGREVLTLRGHSKPVQRLSFGPDGRQLVSVGLDGSVKIWDATIPANSPLADVTKGRSVKAFQLCDRLLIGTIAKDGIRTFDAATGVELFCQEALPVLESHLTFSPDGSRTAASSASTIRVWDSASKRHHLFLENLKFNVLDLAFSPDGQRIAAIGSVMTVTGERFDPVLRRKVPTFRHSSELRIWDIAANKELFAQPGQYGLDRVLFSPNGRYVVCLGRTRFLHAWDSTTGREVFAHQLEMGSWNGKAAFRGDGQWLAVARSDHSVIIIDPATGREVIALRGHGDEVRCLAFSPDGKRLASDCADHTVRIWDLTLGLPVLVLEVDDKSSPLGITFSRDGKRLFRLGWNKVLKVWEAPTLPGT